MADPFVAEIRIVPFDFAPGGWAFCDGQLLPISQNVALYTLLGTTYGGDGASTFALPDLRGRAPMHPGQGPGLSPRVLGETGGSEDAPLLASEIPAHTHAMSASPDPGDAQLPTSNRSLARSSQGFAYQSAVTGLTSMAPETLAATGGNVPHNNLMPFLTLTFSIALRGVFPSRS